MQAAHGKVKVLLDGQGSDELLGGYFHYFAAYLASLMQDFRRTKHPSRLISLVRSIRRINALVPQSNAWGPLVNCLPRPLKGALHRVGRLARRVDVSRLEMAPRILHQDFVNGVQGKEIVRDYPAVYDDDLNNLLYWQLMSQSIPALLHTEDRNSMAFSIEARTPFLDYRLVEFCLGLPYDWKIREGTTKFILRRALATDLPQEISGRLDKKGYPTPMARWFREGQRDKMKEILYSDEARRRNIFHFPGVQYRVERHCAGAADASWEIYRWLTTELWFREFLD
jgi:asparagine synthase (glutamine-hydrolysing)